jgi:hypothetical protein
VPLAAKRYPTAIAIAAAVLMIAQQVADKAARDGLFLSHFDVAQLPKAVIAGALVSLAGVVVMSFLLTRAGPARVVPSAFAASAALFLFERMLLDPAPGLTAALLYLHMSGFGVIVISGFWSLVNERFDPHAAKPRIARIAAGATLGGVLGGMLANVVADSLGFPSMLVVLALLNLACAALLLPLGAGLGGPAPGGRVPVRSGIALIRGIRYLRHMAALLTLLAMTAALVDFAFKSQAAAHFQGREQLVSFFAAFYAVAGVAGFLLQSALGPRILQRFGIGPALSTLPLVLLAGGLFASFAVSLASTALLRGAQSVLGTSLFRSAFELLYAPLPPHAKRPTKTIIDVAGDRLGDVLGGALVLALLAVAPGLPVGVMVLLAAMGAALALALVVRLERGYVEQLAGTLRSGAVSLAEHDVLDATTRRILAETSAGAEREALLERVRELRRDRARPALPGPIFGGDDHETGASAGGEDLPLARDGRLADAAQSLCSGDEARVREVLRGDFMDLRLVPFLLPLLAHPRLAQDARTELRWLLPRVCGQLTDALLDPDQPLAVRQRLPAVMEISHNPRVVHGLLEGLADTEFSVRYASARALARMRSRNPRLVLPTHAVYDAVRREVAVERDTWRTRSLGEDVVLPGDEAPPGGDGSSLSLDHVFTVLGLVLDRDALRLSLQALGSDDRRLRGTALEYLDNVLPDDLRRRLWWHLGLVVPDDASRSDAHRTSTRRTPFRGETP